MADVIFADGIIFKLPRQGAPDFVKGSLSFKVDEAIKFLQQHQENGWCNVNLKVSRNGKAYADLDTWKPTNEYSSTAKNVNSGYVSKASKSLSEQGFTGNEKEDDIPF